MTLVKLALIRDTTTPIGQPGRMHLNCRCGSAIDVPEPFTDAIVTCPGCRQQFDSTGYLVTTPEPHMNDAERQALLERSSEAFRWLEKKGSDQ